jgi:predicted methyltransferase
MRIATGAIVLVVSILAAPLGTAAGDDPVSVAVNDPTRTEADRARDARDHTNEVLKFFGIAPGMTVVDLFAGGGYYSEVIGRIVGGGSSGKVYMQNNAAYQTFIGDALTQRVKGGRLQNVVKLDAEIGQLGIPPASVDLVLMSMSYHDLYFKADDWAVDPKTLFTEVHTMLKPGGTLAIIDHSAIAGTGSNAAQTLHRIDEEFARSDIESRGFKFAGSLDVLHNPADDRTKTVFDPAVRGKTDRFIYKFGRE